MTKNIWLRIILCQGIPDVLKNYLNGRASVVMKICYFGAYNKDYPRNSILRKGLKQNGNDVIECQIPFTSKKISGHLKLIEKYIHMYSGFDAIIVAELNQFVVPLAKILAQINRTPLIFDIFFSLYDSAVNDRKVISRKALKALYFRLLDKISLILPNIILSDTEEHCQYYHDAFGVPYNKMRVVRVGFDPDIFYPYKNNDLNNEIFTVSFIGTFIPLHGVSYIIKAAKLISKYEDIKFEILGDGQTYKRDYQLAKDIGCHNIKFINPVPLKDLPIYIARADVCLGIFGDSSKARRVIPNKIYQALGMKKPVVTGDSPAVKELFKDQEHVLLCSMANPSELADAIIKLKEDKQLRYKISESGYRLVRDSVTPKYIGKRLTEIIKEQKMQSYNS